MIVRLKGSTFPARGSIRRKFQFYDSPIKRGVKEGKKVHPTKFQFYDSPIKRLEEFNRI